MSLECGAVDLADREVRGREADISTRRPIVSAMGAKRFARRITERPNWATQKHSSISRNGGPIRTCRAHQVDMLPHVLEGVREPVADMVADAARDAELLVTDKLRSYASAFRRLRLTCPHEQGLRKNNRAENWHQVRRCGGESARCSGSSRLAPPSGFSACTPPSTTPSISNAISSRARRSGSSELRRRTNGEMRLPQRDRVFRPRLLLLDSVNLTMRAVAIKCTR
jgi:hypothetical protein